MKEQILSSPFPQPPIYLLENLHLKISFASSRMHVPILKTDDLEYCTPLFICQLGWLCLVALGEKQHVGEREKNRYTQIQNQNLYIVLL